MAEEFSRNRLYEYGANSNLVLESERDGRRRNDEAKGEVETLRGKVNTIKMGERSRVPKSSIDPRIISDEFNVAKKQKVGNEDRESRKLAIDLSVRGGSNVKLLSESRNGGDLDNTTIYRPLSIETKSAFEELLTVVKIVIGEQPQSILFGATTEILSILKDDSITIQTKEEELNKALSTHLPNSTLNQMLLLSKRLTDFSLNNTQQEETAIETTEEGMAVIFGDDVVDDHIDDDGEEEDEELLADEKSLHIPNDAISSNSKSESGPSYSSSVDDEILDPFEIDAYWLQRQLSKHYNDSNTTSKLADDVLVSLAIPEDRACENRLVMLLDFDKFALIKILMKNRFVLYYCIRLKQSQSEVERQKIENEMENDLLNGGLKLLERLRAGSNVDTWIRDRIGSTSFKSNEMQHINGNNAGNNENQQMSAIISSSQQLKLESLSFQEGSHLMSNSRCELPEKSWRAQKKGYEEVHIPALKPTEVNIEDLVSIESLPIWMHAAFSGVKTLNRIQSKISKAALFQLNNLLVCAPTGSGKTNVAVLCILGVLNQFRDEETHRIRLGDFKIVYIAPMKALVQECVQNFNKRLQSFGIICKELSGDQSLTQSELEETSIIVTTPEKWDIVTRKTSDKSFTSLVRLVIIDEIHLLHDDRGPVLEAVVARTLRSSELTNEPIRLVGLSATLPNYEDVAAFLRVDPEKGLFYFDGSYRPVPLQQQFIGITEKKALKKVQLMNEICYEKSLLHAGKNQILIFTHSRADTVKTAKAIRDLAISNGTLTKFIQENSASAEILKTESTNIKNADLKDLVNSGFAVHHAGLSRSDRTLVEDLFADKHVQVLVSTATLAWGVNLPCHTVIIKGTQIYSPEKGGWSELSPLDVLQMMGRAGRYGLDSEGEGIILTSHSELQYYLSLLNQQLPIESQLVRKLPDLLNAEIVSGSIANVNDAAHWLGYTYLFVRMLKNPELYNCDQSNDDANKRGRRLQLACAAITTLERNDLVKFDRITGCVSPTYLGKISSYYYITNDTMSTYKTNLRPSMNEIDVFRLFSMSGEFKYLQVREEEKLELSKLLSRVPIPVKESVDDPIAKINVLLQAYISRLSLEGFAIVADMIFIQQSACRLLRALLEISMAKKWAALSGKLLDICKMVERRLWLSQCPLRQFTTIPDLICRKLEKIQDISWDRYYDLKPQDFGELVKMPKMGKTLYKFVHMIPKLSIDARAYPISGTSLELKVTLMQDFEFNEAVHGPQILFWLYVEDGDGEKILYREPIIFKRRHTDISWSFTTIIYVKLQLPLPQNYFLKVLPDRWMHGSTFIPINFKHLILPAISSPISEVLDLEPLAVTALDPTIQAAFPTIQQFNALQTQVYSQIYEQNSNMVLCSPVGSGKSTCVQLAILKFLNENYLSSGDGSSKKCLYIHPIQESCERIYREIASFIQDKYQVNVALLTGDQTVDIAQIKLASLIISTPTYWNSIGKKWRQRKAVQEISLYIFDDLHYIQSKHGSTYELVVSRSRFIESQLGKTVRYIGISHSLLFAKDIAEWLGISPSSIFNFGPDSRPGLMDVVIVPLDSIDHNQRVASTSRHIFTRISSSSSLKFAPVVFVPSKKQANLLAIDLMHYLFKPGAEQQQSQQYSISDKSVKLLLESGIAFMHDALSEKDINVILDCIDNKLCKVVVLTFSMRNQVFNIRSDLVIVVDSMKFNGQTEEFEDLHASELLEMLSHIKSHEKRSYFIVFSHDSKVQSLEHVLHEPLPLESNFHEGLHDILLGEISNNTIRTKADAVDYLTWTYFYRRLGRNPNYYNLAGTSVRHISDHLSELIENTVNDLEAEKLISIDNDFDLVPMNLGMIASHYDISHLTVDMFSSTITNKTKLAGLIEIISHATEFEVISFDQNHISVLRSAGKKMFDGITVDSLQQKIFLCLQLHFSCNGASKDLVEITARVLEIAIKLAHALVDVIASRSWLKPALAAMELSQMIVQGLSMKDSPLLQIPFITKDAAIALQDLNPPVSSIYDFIELDESIRNNMITLTPNQLSKVAKFCNSYPAIDFNYSLLSNSVGAGDKVTINAIVSRNEESDDAGRVVSSKFSSIKYENWYVVVGDPDGNNLYAVKKVVFRDSSKVKIDFFAPDIHGSHTFVIYLMCDSYIGCDQEYEFELSVAGAN